MSCWHSLTRRCCRSMSRSRVMVLWHFEVDGRPLLPADGSLVGFSELIHRRSHFSTSLQVRHAGDTTKRTAFHTCSAIDYLSHEVTRSEHLWKCSTFVLRSLRKCHEMGGEEFVRSLPLAPESSRRPDSPLSRAFQASGFDLAFFLYLLWRVRKKIGRMLFGERWILLFRIVAAEVRDVPNSPS